MKKFVALLLAVLLVMVNIAALADGEGGGVPTVPSEPTRNSTNDNVDQLGFEKKYTVTGSDTTTVIEFPAETLSFTVAKNGNDNPDNTMITVANKPINGATTLIPVTVPDADESNFTKPGVYKYTVKENEPSTAAAKTQGVEYTAKNTTVYVDVYVWYGTDGKLMVGGTNVYTEIKNEGTENATKEDDITNNYSLGTLTVNKTIDGNMAQADKPFTVEVTLTATGKVYSDITIKPDAEGATTSATTIDGDGWTGDKKITLTLIGGKKAEFINIPVGVTYSVKETGITDITKDATVQVNKINDVNAYAITYSTTTGTAKNEDAATDGVTGTISTTASTASIENYKNVKVPTGITLETLPYVLIMAIAMVGAVALFARKREEY